MFKQDIFPDTLRILYLEDNPVDFRCFREYLKDSLPQSIHETEIVWCATLGQALEVLRHQQFHVVVTGLNLPDTWGIEAVDHIMESYPEQFLIVLATTEDTETAFACIRKGAQEFLSKRTVNEYMLSAAILQGLNRHKIRLGLMSYIREMPLAVG